MMSRRTVDRCSCLLANGKEGPTVVGFGKWAQEKADDTPRLLESMEDMLLMRERVYLYLFFSRYAGKIFELVAKARTEANILQSQS